MADYGYTSGDYTSSCWNGPQSNSYGAATGQGRIKPVGGYFPDSPYATKPSYLEQTEYKYSSPVQGRDSQRAGEFFTKIQTEVSQHTGGGGGACSWCGPPYSTHYSDQRSKNDSWNRHTADNYMTSSARKGGVDDYYGGNNRTTITEAMNTSRSTGGWNSRHGSGGWSTTAASSLSEPTNSIGAALESLKEAAAMPSSQPAVFTAALVSSAGYGYGYGYGGEGNIDSMDATRRYGNFKLTSRPGGYY